MSRGSRLSHDHSGGVNLPIAQVIQFTGSIAPRLASVHSVQVHSKQAHSHQVVEVESAFLCCRCMIGTMVGVRIDRTGAAT